MLPAQQPLRLVCCRGSIRSAGPRGSARSDSGGMMMGSSTNHAGSAHALAAGAPSRGDPDQCGVSFAGNLVTMSKITVYSTNHCGYCRNAEALLRRHRIPFETIDVTGDDDAREALVERAHGRRTVPVIFHGDEVIGGFAELARMAASGELARRFAPAND